MGQLGTYEGGGLVGTGFKELCIGKLGKESFLMGCLFSSVFLTKL